LGIEMNNLSASQSGIMTEWTSFITKKYMLSVNLSVFLKPVRLTGL